MQKYTEHLSANAINSINELNEKIANAKSSEEEVKYRMQRINKAIEINSVPFRRSYRGYFPY